MVAFTAMGEGTTGTPLHKGSEAQSVGAVQTPHQTEESVCVCVRVCVRLCVCMRACISGLHAQMHVRVWVHLMIS